MAAPSRVRGGRDGHAVLLLCRLLRSGREPSVVLPRSVRRENPQIVLPTRNLEGRVDLQIKGGALRQSAKEPTESAALCFAEGYVPFLGALAVVRSGPRCSGRADAAGANDIHPHFTALCLKVVP